MNLQEIIVISLAVYFPTRFIVQDTSLKSSKSKFAIYAQKTKHRLLASLIHQLMNWPYWTAFFTVPIVFFLPSPIQSYLAVTGVIYLIYDTVHR